MKIAALFDIHGNLPALNAVLAELIEIQPDIIIVGGDIVSGPMPIQTLERLSQLGAQVLSISGNADREVVMTFDGRPFQRQYLPPVSEDETQALRWVADQLSQSQRDLLANLPQHLVFQVEGLGSILFCHATPRDDEELFTPLTPEQLLRPMFSDVKQNIVVCGHTHIHFERHIDNIHILNAGSVGMPYANQPGAYWLLLSPEGYTFRHTPYDTQLAAQEILATSYPKAQEFANTNVLTMPTASEAAEYFEGLAEKSRSPQ